MLILLAVSPVAIGDASLEPAPPAKLDLHWQYRVCCADVKRRWVIAAPEPVLQQQLVDSLRITPVLAQVLINRGHKTPESASLFLNPRLRDLADPFLLQDMQPAVECVLAALSRREKIAVFGDYDVDGVTATAQVCEILRALGGDVSCYLPNRMDEGYGLSQGAVETCYDRLKPNVLIAVDCGTTAVPQLEWLRAKGVETVVLDHHELSPGQGRPPCAALVNPILEPGSSSHRFLASAGIAFKFGHALLKEARARQLPGAADIDLKRWLDLAAIGTICDVVPLVGENRLLAATGLPLIAEQKRPGLRALLEVAQIKPPVTPGHVGFGIGPRLNAAGRLQDAEFALELLLCAEPARALELARWLDANNRERQAIEKQIVDEATQEASKDFHAHSDYVLVLANAAWHVGVVGIAASRVLRTFYRPTLVIGGTPAESVNDGWRGSARSIEGYDVTAGLAACSDLLLRFGGHEMAAGFSVHPEAIGNLRTAINEHARKTIPPDLLIPSWRLDAELTLSECTDHLIEELARVEPTGQENPRPLFCSRRVRVQREPRQVGRTGEHLKLWLGDGDTNLDAIGFGMGKREFKAGDALDIVFVPELNEFQGRRSIQLKLQDAHKSED